MSYYTINEEAARTANDLNSHYTCLLYTSPSPRD